MRNKLQKELVIYDLDGTLVDSAITVTDILNSMRSSLKMGALETSFVRPFTALGGEALIKMAMNCDDSEVTGYLNEFRQIYARLEVHPDTIFAGVIETLQSLKDCGIHLAICTNKPRDLAIKTLNALKLTPFFDCKICGDDVANLKPSTDPIFKITRSLSIEVSRCIFVGDTSVDYNAAKACDMDFLFYDSGYDDMLLEAHNPERIVSHVEVLSYVDNFPKRLEA